MSELRNIPNVGKRTEQDLLAMGYTTIASLKGKSAQELYDEECALRGTLLDRCQLYLYRAVEYFVNTPSPDSAKLKWWFWKDEYVQPSPCGAVCIECPRFPSECAGCRKIEGKVFWTKYLKWMWGSRPNCCGSCRSGGSGPWGRSRKSIWTYVSLRPAMRKGCL